MKTFGLYGLLILTLLVAIAYAKYFPGDDADDLEVSDMDARSFLKTGAHKKPTDDSNCVLCKFNVVPCCSPNLCIKKRFRPDECLELKGRDQ